MRSLFITLAFFAISVFRISAQSEVIDKVVATVGGETVLLSEVEEQFALTEAQRGVLPAEARCEIMNQILITKLLLNQSKLDSIEVTDEEVEDQLNARIERILGYMNNDVSQFEAYYGQSISQVKDQFREDLKNQLLVERMRSNVINSITVTPSEVKSFFRRIPNDSLPYFNSEVEIGEIVYKPKINAEEKKAATEKLEMIREKILNGEATFEEMAQKFSDDGSARGGGDLGWTRRGKFVPEFEAAAYKLEKDEISPVVESQFGFHIIQMLERRGNSIHVRHILIKPAVTDADLELARVHLDSIRHLIAIDSLGFSQAVKQFSDKEQQSFNNDGRMVNPTTGNTFFEIGDLDPDIYFAIDTLEINEISAPFQFRDPTGEIYFRIAQLQSRTSPHKANLALDYSKIQKAAIQAKQNEFISDWVEEKIDATFIMVDPLYANCPNLSIWRKEGIKP
ncbi:MAG: peptidylprolyl isomerase [Lewinellaceae bacterium]|nr:peptidylprolyl isomerase [Lewinella sp.]MCB9277657.1 peptidylprolyl isomerase [Lewinellaceae bacterium]